MQPGAEINHGQRLYASSWCVNDVCFSVFSKTRGTSWVNTFANVSVLLNRQTRLLMWFQWEAAVSVLLKPFQRALRCPLAGSMSKDVHTQEDILSKYQMRRCFPLNANVFAHVFGNGSKTANVLLPLSSCAMLMLNLAFASAMLDARENHSNPL